MNTYEKILPLTSKTCVKLSFTETATFYELYLYNGKKFCEVQFIGGKFCFFLEKRASMLSIRKDTFLKFFRFIAEDTGFYMWEIFYDIRRYLENSDFSLFLAFNKKLK